MDVSDAARKLSEAAVRNVGQQLGINLDAGQVIAYAEILAHLVSGKEWHDAHAAGLAAQARITTQIEAEEAARNRK